MRISIDIAQGRLHNDSIALIGCIRPLKKKMKDKLKILINNVIFYLMFPLYLIIIINQKLSKSEKTFLFFARAFSKYSGLIGEFLRRAFYKWTLHKVGSNLVVGFGSFFTHRDVSLGDAVWIGQYSIIGKTFIGSNVMISDQVSILSGRYHHTYDCNGKLIENKNSFSKISLGKNSWIGANSVIMANVGEGSIVGAGSVVVKNINSFSVVAGNPARPIRKRK